MIDSSQESDFAHNGCCERAVGEEEEKSAAVDAAAGGEDERGEDVSVED